MKKRSKSEQMRGNTHAKIGVHESIVMRLPVQIVDGLYEAIAAQVGDEGLSIDLTDRDIIDEVLLILKQHVEKATGKPFTPPLALRIEDEDAHLAESSETFIHS